jgi:hypothetical protein
MMAEIKASTSFFSDMRKEKKQNISCVQFLGKMPFIYLEK